MQQAMAKQPAEAIKVPVSVPVQAANAALKAARCLCTEDFLREASHAETAKKLFDNDTVVDIDALRNVGLISNPRDGVKILGEGDLERKLTVKVNYFSKTAQEKIEAAGGKAEVI